MRVWRSPTDLVAGRYSGSCGHDLPQCSPLEANCFAGAKELRAECVSSLVDGVNGGRDGMQGLDIEEM